MVQPQDVQSCGIGSCVPVAEHHTLQTVSQVVRRGPVGVSVNQRSGAGVPEPAPRFLRIETIDMMGGVSVNVNGRVIPGKQWEVAGALKARLIDEFQREGVKPWSQ